MRTRQPNLMSPRPKNQRRLAQGIPNEAEKIKARLAKVAALRGAAAGATVDNAKTDPTG